VGRESRFRARAHAREMVERNRLSHQFNGEPDLMKRVQTAGARFSRLAENVAAAPSVNELHIGWMNSIPHRNKHHESGIDRDRNCRGNAR